MKLYPVYLVIAAVTVLSPGPGVVMTLTNALQLGVRAAFGGIFGIAAGALVIAAFSATTVGVLFASSPAAFTLLKFAGAGYLAWLGVRLWRAPLVRFDEIPVRPKGHRRKFLEGMTLQFGNPKAIFFFLSVLPQFIDRGQSPFPQYALMALTYSLLIVLIHGLYAVGAQRTRPFLTSAKGAMVINRTGGTLFVVFALLMATATR
ncbi:LysE family translocator [Geomonas sp. Red32]|uniref:LysE family translocator n=1 Tax=Geomonas sp. Red32 TaxID=2912856 RepID=UPI00202CAD17|nr:LysE family translocator [Geomonas sp. Red32]MCM0082577.1 LysE family translocator [Geomonas sp. Red32]